MNPSKNWQERLSALKRIKVRKPIKLIKKGTKDANSGGNLSWPNIRRYLES